VFDARDRRHVGVLVVSGAHGNSVALPRELLAIGPLDVKDVSDPVGPSPNQPDRGVALDEPVDLEGLCIVVQVLDVNLGCDKVGGIEGEPKVGEGRQVLGRDKLKPG